MSAVQIQQHANSVVLRVVGEFTFSINREFREAYKSHPDADSFTVDLSQASYMDSAGLGMLVQLRDFAGGTPEAVSIAGANGVIKNILEVANFNKLFRLKSANTV